jgi:hypothetical protein
MAETAMVKGSRRPRAICEVRKKKIDGVKKRENATFLLGRMKRLHL